MDLNKASLVKSSPEKIASGSLYAENGLGGGSSKIDDTVRQTCTVRDHVLTGAVISVSLVVDAQLGFLY